MRSVDIIRTASIGVSSNLSRSFLTTLGIIIGVGSVVLMTGIGKSMEGLILGQISSLGAKSMVIFPGHGPEQGAQSMRAGFDSLNHADVEALGTLTSVRSIAPIIFVPGIVSARREQSTPTVLGTRPTFFENQSIEAQLGRLLSESDEEAVRFIAVLGPDIADDLFPGRNPIGERISIAGRGFAVVGVTKPIGSQFFQNADERMYIPFSVSKAITNQSYVNYMTFQAASSFQMAFADVKSLLRKRHGIVNPDDDPDDDDFIVRSSEQANSILGTVSLSITLFITFVAGISLIVGGIGIMNVMLIAVSERTREIGLRKALGALRRDLLLQFLVESSMLTLIGALIGVLLGIVGSFLIAGIVHRFLPEYMFSLSLPAILIALVVAAFTGIAFGMHPAIKAAGMKPVEALRYE